MRELDIQLFWLNKAARLEKLYTSNGATLTIIDPGMINHNQGPDFLHATIKIDNTLWVGSIEIHLKTSGWYSHHHNNDSHYKNVILHVVWEHDHVSFDHSALLVLSDHLKDISALQTSRLLSNELRNNSFQRFSLETIAELGLQRLERKANEILLDVKSFQGNWQFVTIRKIIYAFGTPLNSDAFQEIIHSVYPLFIRSHLVNYENVKSIIFGQAGLFAEMTGQEVLQYKKLCSELLIKPVYKGLVKFRTRPNNFPELRLHQFVKFIFQYPSIFRDLIELDLDDADWIHAMKKELGVIHFNKMVVNVFVPILIAYSKFYGNIGLRKKALDWLSLLPPESNRFTKHVMIESDFSMHALHTQGILEFYKAGIINYSQLKLT